MEFELTGRGLLFVVLAVFALVVGIIFALRYFLRTKNDGQLAEKYENASRLQKLKSRVKYPEVDGLSYSGILWRFGLVAALVLILSAFNWTQYEEYIDTSEYSLEVEEELEIEPPRTELPKPPPPPPPPPVIEEVPDDVVIEDKVEIADKSIDEAEVIVNEPPKPVKKAPPPPPPPAPKEEKIFKRVEQMPRFPGCEDAGTEAEKKKCADQKLLQFIYKNIEYTPMAQENGIEGVAVIEFVVGKDGSIEDITIRKDLQMGLGAQAKKAVEKMKNMPEKWTPGRQQGQAVKVRFTLPVRFKLE